MQTLIDRIRRREARCGIIGLGYVGLPLALEFARAGFRGRGVAPVSSRPTSPAVVVAWKVSPMRPANMAMSSNRGVSGSCVMARVYRDA